MKPTGHRTLSLRVIDLLTPSSSGAKPRRNLTNTDKDLVDTTVSNKKSYGVTKKSTRSRKRKLNSGNKCFNGIFKKKRLAYGDVNNKTIIPDRRLGDCPICWDQLGTNPLASTKCGHVYCFKCLEKMLKISKKCPTCRRPLKKTSDYHPIYLC